MISAIVIALFLLSFVALSYAASDQSSLKDRVQNKIANYYEGYNFDISTPGNGRVIINCVFMISYPRFRVFGRLKMI
jgi:hypothetical protein